MGCLREGVWLCNDCRQQVLLPPLRCIVCAKERPRGATCSGCLKSTALRGVVSAGPYGSPLLKRGVHWLKFKGVVDCAEVLIELIVPRLMLIAPIHKLAREAVLIPIPLHRRRLRERGFNQSEVLANGISKMTGIATECGILFRPAATRTQTKLPPSMREQNMVKAFQVSGEIPNKRRVLLVDDVTTTGSTLSAAAQALRKNGAREIWGVTVARG